MARERSHPGGGMNCADIIDTERSLVTAREGALATKLDIPVQTG